MKTLSVIKLMPATKAEQKNFKTKVKEEILSGVYSPIEIDCYLKSIEDLIKDIRKDKEIKEAVMESADLYPEKSIEFTHSTVTKCSRKSYDFSEDTKWANIKNAINNLTKELKTREDILKTADGKLADIETGEVLQSVPHKTTEYLKISIK